MSESGNAPRAVPSLASRFAGVVVTAVIQLAVLLVFAEIAVRAYTLFSNNINALLYNPGTLPSYSRYGSLQELLNASPAGYNPFIRGQTYVYNSKSFPTREYSEQKPAGSFRILAIGDSFTASSGNVPNNRLWPVVLEAGLRQDRGATVEILNLGVSGVGTEFELRLWQLEGSRLHADLVILGFCIGNDFTDGQRHPASTQRGLLDYLTEYSHAIRLAVNLYTAKTQLAGGGLLQNIKTGGERKGGYPVNTRYNPAAPTFSMQGFHKMVRQRMSITHRDDRERLLQLLDRLKPLLLDFNTQVNAAGAEFVVVLIPDEYQLYPSLVSTVLEDSDSVANDYDLDSPQLLLAEFLERNSIRYLDLLPVFRQAAATQPLYRRQDTHWNPAGNKLAADTIMGYLVDSQLVP